MKRWICNDVWWNILPLLDRFQLGLNLALVSFRFDWLVDKHFDAKTELTIWREIEIHEDERTEEAKLRVLTENFGFVDFPLPIGPLPIKIRFKSLQIQYIDHSVITFLHTNKQIFTNGTNFELRIPDQRPKFWGVFVRKIWPIFAGNIRRLRFVNKDCLDNLHCHISPTMITDLKLMYSIHSGLLLPDAIADDGLTATNGQALAKWLHTPTTDGQPKRLLCECYDGSRAKEWINSFKGAFLRATSSSACYIIKIGFGYLVGDTTPTAPFELENERTKEMLTLEKHEDGYFRLRLLSRFTIGRTGNGYCRVWLLKRFPIGRTVQWEKENLEHLNSVRFELFDDRIGPLSSNENSSDQCPGPSGQRMK